jgi:replicative DNA helicase
MPIDFNAPELPHDDEAERTVLGACLADNERIPVASERLAPPDFFRGRNRAAWEVIQDCAARGEEASLPTLRLGLERTGRAGLWGANGREVGELTAYNRFDFGGAVEAVAERSHLRAVISAHYAGLAECWETGVPAATLAEHAQETFFALSQRGERGGFVSARDAVDEVVAEIEVIRLAEPGTVGRAVHFGLRDLDRVTGGMHSGDLVILAARTGVGKSALALHVAVEAARRGQTTALFSVEVARQQLASRLLASASGIDGWRLRHPETLTDQDYGDLAAGVESVPAGLWFDDSRTLSLRNVRARARHLKAQHGLGLVIVDYLQLMKPAERMENRALAVAELSRGLREVAQELDVPVLCLAQLNREAEKEAGDPKMHMLRESGSLEQDADTVLLLVRDGQEVKIIVEKQRHGPVGVAWANFDPATQRFTDQARSDYRDER